jgi:hypothetical protein
VTAGSSHASPSATLRMAAASSAGAASLRTKPAAPARSAAYTALSTLKVLKHHDAALALRWAGDALAHERLRGPDDAVGSLGDHLEIRLGSQQHGDARSEERLIVSDETLTEAGAPDHARGQAVAECRVSGEPIGNSARTRYWWSCPAPASKLPPTMVTRSCRPRSP